MNNRRKLIVALGSVALGAPLTSFTQQKGNVRRIGFLGPGSPSSSAALTEAFRQGMRDLGHIEGKNFVIEYRWAEGKAERLSGLAAELVSLKPDVIVTASPQGTVAAKKATTVIPIVFAGVGDPVGMGVVASLARPGGNVTGLTNLVVDTSRKRLDLLKESFPRVSPIAVLWNSMNPGNVLALKETKIAAQFLGIKLLVLEVRSPDDFDRAFQAVVSGHAQALLPIPDPLMNDHVRRVVDFAAKNRLPAIYARTDFVDAGGLMSYAPDYLAIYRRAAAFVDKILRGAKPADLPVEEPTRIELVINLKTAKQLGLTIPPSVVARADRVIE
jgi:putative ABC transport system substrate-binding protein